HTGKGLSVLSGRDLFSYKRDLFKDDDNANDVVVKEHPGDLVEEQIKDVAEKVQSDLFLDGNDDDLDDLVYFTHTRIMKDVEGISVEI
ncbi:unnamed protein product, partial [marine sediment metagenome]